jgi:hypothetical protein
MLLSMLVSFLLARIFRKKVYVVLTAVGLLLISFLSVGVPEYVFMPENLPQPSTQGLLLSRPLPLSFPFYTSIYHRTPMGFRDVEWEDYRLYFITIILEETRIVSVSVLGSAVFSFSWSTYILCYAFFLVINIVGAGIGHWISRREFVDKMLKKRTPSESKMVN